MRRAVTSIAVLAGFLAILGCEGDVTTTDPRFSTPERTVDTLLASYGIDAMSQEAVRERLGARVRFELQDRDAFEACFSDLEDTPASEGLAGWVLGALAAGKDELRTEIAAARATVSPRDGVRIVLRSDESGAWRIVIAESVPEEVRTGMAAISERHDRRARATGVGLSP